MQVQYWGGRHTDPSFDASAMLHPLTYHRWQPSSLAQYETGATGDQPGHHDAHALRAQQQRSQNSGRRSGQNKKGAAAGGAKFKSPLALLQADQAALKQRKANIARFGSSWLRPAGVPKTYQAMMDEAAEREEQEAQARREAAAAEEQRAAREAEAQAAAAAAAVGGITRTLAPMGDDAETGIRDFGSEGAMEVDLDDEVPAAEEVEYDEEEDEDDDDEDEDEDGTRERDLDDSIPEAGSYQHTDTDVEDEDSISLSISEHVARNPHADPGVPPENALNPPRILDGATGRFVHSIEGTSEFMPVESHDSSMLLSSPSAAREREMQRTEEYMTRRGI